MGMETQDTKTRDEKSLNLEKETSKENCELG